MAEEKETAEQKLLKMIETSSGSGGEASKAKKKVASKQNILGLVQSVNKILILVVFLAGLFLVWELKNGLAMAGKRIDFSIDQTSIKNSFESGSLIPTVQRLSYYLTGTKARNLFEPFDPAGNSKVAAGEESTEIMQMTRNFRLVGVSWLDTIESASVMLEDTQKKVTHFLQRGERLGNLTVEEIYADSVELSHENEEIIIRYDKTQM